MNTTARSESVDLSIIIDTETLHITGELLLDGRMAFWQQAAEQIAPRTYEIILCTDQPFDSKIKFPPGWKGCVSPMKGYYAGKTAGGLMAKGRYLSWGDIDCRPGPDYFTNLLEHFERTGCAILGGRTFYDGEDFVTRANSAISWGYLHGVDHLGPHDCYVGNNVACRRDAAGDFFGLYTGRYGGDEYITSAFRQRDDPLLLFQDLKIFHESPAGSLRALIDRHLSEICRLALMHSPDGSISTKLALREARHNARAKWITFLRHGAKFGFSGDDLWKARLLFLFYGWLDSAVVLLRSIIPGSMSRWTRHQFGALETCEPVSEY